jgi:uncharacterized protein (UPF0332 family)
MSLHGDLLAPANHLATKEPKRPKQASLRRAVSAAYYALFHFLIDEASRFLISGAGNDRRTLREAIARSFAHQQMKNTSEAFAKNQKNAWKDLFAPVPADLVTVAQTFVDLQQARHQADYDLSKTLTRSEALAQIARAEHALAVWSSMPSSEASRAYLIGLLVNTR